MRKTLYITNKLVLNKLDQVDNQSQYVQDLILKDILVNGDSTDYKDTVNSTIESILKQLDTIRSLMDNKKY